MHHRVVKAASHHARIVKDGAPSDRFGTGRLEVRNVVVTALRTTLGRRDVNLTPEFMGFGNHLYLWVWAHSRRDDRVRPKVLATERMRYWAALTPRFAARFVIESSEIRPTDRRGSYWAYPGSHSPDPRGFTDEQRSEFIREALLPEPLLDGVGQGELATDQCLVVNVRRGDYYSTENVRQYGFDVATYVRAAVERSVAEDGALRRIHVVSDDLAWCRRRMSWLATFADEVSYPPPDADPASHFRDVASARRIVMTNSTFSLWAAAVSNEVHRDNASAIWAPAFFQSVYGSGRCHEYDQHWSFVDDLPGGWQPGWLVGGRDGPDE